MRRWMVVAAIGIAGLFSAGPLSAAERAPSRIYDDAGFEASKSKALAHEIASVQARCDFHELSREGPRMRDVAACEAVVSKVIRRGSSAIGPVLAALDDPRTRWSARRRLYDVLARTKDMRLIEPLIRGMARIATRKIETRAWEVRAINDALRGLTHAPIQEILPGYKDHRATSSRGAIDLVVDWRLWLGEHEGKSHEELVNERLTEELAHVEDPSLERAYRAVSYLLREGREEGVIAGRKLLERPEVTRFMRGPLESEIRRVEAAHRDELAKAKSPEPAPAKAEPTKSPGLLKTGPAKAPSQKKKKPSSMDLKTLS